MGWYGSSLTVGSAMGSPFAGVVIDRIGPWAGFAIIGLLCGVLAGIGLVAVERWRKGGAAAAQRRREWDELLGDPDPVRPHPLSSSVPQLLQRKRSSKRFPLQQLRHRMWGLGLVDCPGELLARALAGGIREFGGFTERELE